jgi:putative radical SAM enzyme (TIGR03279 family)
VRRGALSLQAYDLLRLPRGGSGSLQGVKTAIDSLPEISGVEPLSAGGRSGVQVGDRIVAVNGVSPRDILEWQRLIDADVIDLEVLRGREVLEMSLDRRPGEPVGLSVNSALFDRIHTCDNHCEFCFIYQLPKGMRRSLYLKDDDYRLSFLFGNFTTLTRFTEADLERVIDERLSPLYVSVHASAPHTRAEMLRNNRGGFSLRWMKILLDNNIDVRAQIVLCPGVNDGQILEDTLAGLLEEYPQLESVAIVPLGLSRFNTESRMRVHTQVEAESVIRTVAKWQARYQRAIARQPLHLADEFYLVAGVQVPEAGEYGEFPMLEDGVGLVRSFLDSFSGLGVDPGGKKAGFFASVDTSSPTDYVRPINPAAETSLRTPVSVSLTVRRREPSVEMPLAVVTGSYGASVIREVLPQMGFSGVPVVEVVNEYFGGNTAVAGLMTFEDISRTLRQAPDGYKFLIPDVCLNEDRFLDGHTLQELSQEFNIEVIATSGAALRTRLESAKREASHV